VPFRPQASHPKLTIRDVLIGEFIHEGGYSAGGAVSLLRPPSAPSRECHLSNGWGLQPSPARPDFRRAEACAAGTDAHRRLPPRKFCASFGSSKLVNGSLVHKLADAPACTVNLEADAFVIGRASPEGGGVATLRSVLDAWTWKMSRMQVLLEEPARGQFAGLFGSVVGEPSFPVLEAAEGEVYCFEGYSVLHLAPSDSGILAMDELDGEAGALDGCPESVLLSRFVGDVFGAAGVAEAPAGAGVTVLSGGWARAADAGAAIAAARPDLSVKVADLEAGDDLAATLAALRDTAVLVGAGPGLALATFLSPGAFVVEVGVGGGRRYENIARLRNLTYHQATEENLVQVLPPSLPLRAGAEGAAADCRNDEALLAATTGGELFDCEREWRNCFYGGSRLARAFDTDENWFSEVACR
jgi:hypothetical protein